jgi:hypothetical protein
MAFASPVSNNDHVVRAGTPPARLHRTRHGATIGVPIKGNLTGIVRAVRLSRATMKNIRQNLFFAFVHNVLGIPVAAGVPYPTFGLLLSPLMVSP